jgi:hypothetical protein
MEDLDELIEVQVRFQMQLIAAAGREPTERDRHICREVLRSLVRTAQNHAIAAFQHDMQTAQELPFLH